jgi:hypothetical protein
MIRLLLLPALFASLLLAAHILIGPSPVTMAAATLLAIVGLVCTRTEDRVSRRTIRILAIVAGAGSIVAAVLLSSWFVVAVVAFTVVYLCNADERVVHSRVGDTVRVSYRSGPTIITLPPGEVADINGDLHEANRLWQVTERNAEGFPLSVTPVFDSRANVLTIASRDGFKPANDRAVNPPISRYATDNHPWSDDCETDPAPRGAA